MDFAEFMKSNDTIYKNLFIFDFDGTLVFTPGPKLGKKTYEQVTGQPWSYVGWWANPKSLREPIFPNPAPISMLNHEMFQKFSEGKNDEKTYVMVLSGRKENMRKDVERILDDYALVPDEVLLTPKQVDTLAFKKQIIIDSIKRFTNLNKVEMWDDRGAKFAKETGRPTDNHIAAFKQLGQRIEMLKELQNPEENFAFKVNEV